MFTLKRQKNGTISYVHFNVPKNGTNPYDQSLQSAYHSIALSTCQFINPTMATHPSQ